MISSVIQHPILWLVAAFLTGMAVEWILEIFFLRHRLFEAETRARKRGEELDSERFNHNRTQSELKSRMADLDGAQKGRTLAEALLTAARGKLTAAESELAAAHAEGVRANSEVLRLNRELDAVRAEAGESRAARLDLGLRFEALQSEGLSRASALLETKGHLDRVTSDLEAHMARNKVLEQEIQEATRRSTTLGEELAAARALQARTEKELAGNRAERERLATEVAQAEKARVDLEAERDSLREQVIRLDSAAAAARTTIAGHEQKLRTRGDELKQLSAQLGEAAEELSSLKSRCSRAEATLEAAQATRASLERDLASRETELGQIRSAATAAQAAAPDPSLVAELREEVASLRREVASWHGKTEELEAELLSTSEAHRELTRENERLRQAVPTAAPEDSLAIELEMMTRERNELAAELAALRAGGND